jgi:hypothetical protein
LELCAQVVNIFKKLEVLLGSFPKTYGRIEDYHRGGEIHGGGVDFFKCGDYGRH